MAIGVTLDHGAGLGLTTRPGVTRRSTTAVGLTSATVGAGARDLTTRVRIGDLRLWASMVAAAGAQASVSDSAAELAGSPWDSANLSVRGITTALDMR